MDRGAALIVTVLVGALVALQPPANAVLAKHVSDLGAAFTSLVVSTAIVGTLLLLAGDVRTLANGLGDFRPVHAIGGIGGAAFVAVSLIAVRSLGATAFTAAVVSVQLIVAAVLDRLGVLDLEETPITAARGAGVVLLIVGTLLVTSR